MDYLVEVYNKAGDKIDGFRSDSACNALIQLANTTRQTQYFDYVNASCYHRDVVQWELEIK